MGDVFRRIPRTGKFGREIEQYTSQGLMVPDDLTVRIFERHLNILEMQELIIPEQHTLVLDGLPRNCVQADRLAGFIDVLQIFHLKIYDTEKLVERLKARALSENRLDDMSEDVIHRRLNAYHEETYKTLNRYPRELILEVDASQRAIDVLCVIARRLAAIKSP
jgi:adenylate kinase